MLASSRTQAAAAAATPETSPSKIVSTKQNNFPPLSIKLPIHNNNSSSSMTPHVDSEGNLPSSQLSVMDGPSAMEEPLQSQLQSQTQTQTQLESSTQMDCTQQSLPDMDESSSTMSPSPLSPIPVLPWARLVPCVPSPSTTSVDLLPGKSEYWLGRSSTKCDVPIPPGTSLSKTESTMMAWAHSMISNRHCRIVNLGHTTTPATPGDDSHSTTTGTAKRKLGSAMSHSSREVIATQIPQILLEDQSGNGTFVNQTTHLRKGHQRLLHSGDEICLVSAETLRKKITSGRVLQAVLQQYTYIFVATNKPKRPCVNPRAMNYHASSNHHRSGSGVYSSSPRSARRIEAHYDIREVLGDGTSGQVRRAIHRQTGQEFAVKVISLRRQLDLTSMEHEVSMMQSLDHPYIVQLVDVFVHHGIAMYLVMELIAGGDLFDRIVQQERYAEVDARRVMRRLLSAVHYLHETKNIVHRDLKPENILCASPTHVKLADFGLAKIIQADGLKTFCGTPQYFAPEVLERRNTVTGSGRYGKPADMWSLGVILYILLTGRPPFSGDLDPLLAYDALDFESDPSWKAMPLAQELVQQLLRLDPKRRLSVRQACNHPWINTEDGDTHIHPLDDPSVVTRKRLFSEGSERNDEYQQYQSEGNDEAVDSVETDDSNSLVSREDSLLSKEDFAAAATSHQRDESVDFFNLGKLSEQVGGTKKHTRIANTGHRPMSIDGVEERQQSASKDWTKSTANDDFLTTTDISSPPTSSSDGGIHGLLSKEQSVTPSECGDEEIGSRSPLATMDLNERGNRFREQVLRQQDSHLNSGMSSPERQRNIETSQVAVTPNTSNVRFIASKKRFTPDHDYDEPELDPILSQFSSDPSSLTSFPDSPLKMTPTTTTPSSSTLVGIRERIGANNAKSNEKRGKKRVSPEDDTESPSSDVPDHKSRNAKQKTRQTTLSAWFGTKKAKTESN